ncbi:MAG: 2-C-methyl-D-erythritol 2,4-cyclodiphosphate synthase [Planctomycetales bacterium]|nr:2-C-methyl-D-erythritol 2,4-cyclodiphosphate synthase [Planctomycetales bacterium]
MNSNIRIGVGHDTHRLAAGGPLYLGGVKIPHDKHAVGHSDADVLLHAIVDALLGAAQLGDIGEMFPNTDPANRGRDSAEMLHQAMQAVRNAGWEVINLDCIVHAERPKLSPYKTEIRQRIADVLDLARDQIGLKGKTGEGVGPVGAEEAVMAQCVALLRRGSG